MSKTEIVTIFPGIPTDGSLDVAWAKKHIPNFSAWAKAYPELLPKEAEPQDEKKAEPQPPKGKE